MILNYIINLIATSPWTIKSGNSLPIPLHQTMKTVPSTSSSNPADLKGPGGTGSVIASVKDETNITLSPGLKGAVQGIVRRLAANHQSLTPEEFTKFLKDEQQVPSLHASWLIQDVGESI